MARTVLFALFGTAVLAACAPLNTYYKVGASVDRLNRDTTECQVSALRDVPVSTQIRRLPPEYIPPVRRCDATGACVVLRQGYFLPGEAVTYDANADLRQRVERQCMTDRGYAPISIPPCPESITRAAPPGMTKVLPALSPKSCAIRNRDGTFRIVTRG